MGMNYVLLLVWRIIKVIMSYAALGQAANIWHSFYANGGMMY